MVHGSYRFDSSVVANFAAAASSSIQAQTAFLSFSVSLASGCIVVYCQGGILPVEISPQMDFNLSCLCHGEYVPHSEKSNLSLPSRTCCTIHHETGGTWLYQGQSVRLEWQSAQACLNTCRGSIFNDNGIPLVLGSVVTRRAVPDCPTIRATAANAAISFSVLIACFSRNPDKVGLDAIMMPFASQVSRRVSGKLAILDRVEHSH